MSEPLTKARLVILWQQHTADDLHIGADAVAEIEKLRGQVDFLERANEALVKQTSHDQAELHKLRVKSFRDTLYV